MHGHSRSFGLYLLVDFIGASLRLSRAVVLLVSGWMGGGGRGVALGLGAQCCGGGQLLLFNGSQGGLHSSFQMV